MVVGILASILQAILIPLTLPRLVKQTGSFSPTLQTWAFLAFALGFAIKVPLFPFHTWLPDAHVQAPTAGSIILAGVLLKMGTYGYVRFAVPLFPRQPCNLRSMDRSVGGDRHHLRSVGRTGAEGYEVAGCL